MTGKEKPKIFRVGDTIKVELKTESGKKYYKKYMIIRQPSGKLDLGTIYDTMPTTREALENWVYNCPECDYAGRFNIQECTVACPRCGHEVNDDGSEVVYNE